MTPRPAHVLLLGLLLACGTSSLLACGKYGPPLRASEQRAKAAEKPSVEVPLPGFGTPEPEPAPAPEAPAAPEPEREPPPEGSP